MTTIKQQKRKSAKRLQGIYESVCKVEQLEDLARLTGLEKFKISLLAHQPEYRVYEMKKKSGGRRLIEDPAKPLKKLQRKVNTFLQASYFFEKTPAAYGFLVTCKKDPAPRNILTNAQKHLGQRYLLNVDMKDFFHLIKTNMVYNIFSGAPFHFSDELAELMSELCTFKGRLPMGAPTSPALSNFAARGLDVELGRFALRNNMTFTRFVDDMSFSANKEITPAHLNKITDIVHSHAFKLNPEKVKWFGPDDDKIVTGLLLTDDDILLPAEYLYEVRDDIERLQNVIETQNLHGIKQNAWVEQFKQEVQGKISFVQYVLGDEHETSRELDGKFDVAVNPPEEEFGAYSWNDFYNFSV